MLPPVITAQPNDQLFVVDGSGVQFSVTAEGVSLTFQWQKDSVDITDAPGVVTGSDTNTLTIESAGQADEGEYSVVVSNGAGSDTSASASLLTSAFVQMIGLKSLHPPHTIFCCACINISQQNFHHSVNIHLLLAM